MNEYRSVPTRGRQPRDYRTRRWHAGMPGFQRLSQVGHELGVQGAHASLQRLISPIGVADVAFDPAMCRADGGSHRQRS